uniref:hypothetical protein n=1 Tax=Nocardia brasiliensis TaxID=37326 RepID=UPI002454C6AF
RPLNDLPRPPPALAPAHPDAAEAYCRAALAHEEAATGFARVDLADVLLAKGEPAAARALLDEFMATAPAGVPLLAARAVTVTVRQAEGDHAGARALRAELRAEFAAAGFGWHRYADRLSGPEPPS